MDFDPRAVEGWARWREGRDVLIRLLEEIYEPTLEIARKELLAVEDGKSAESLVVPILHKNRRVVWPWGESLNLQFAVPAGNAERLRVHFVGGHREPFFAVEARHEDDHLLRGADSKVIEATRALREQGFKMGHSWGSYWSRPHPPQDWLYDGPGAIDKLLGFVENDVRDLAQSGIFAALPASSSSAVARPDPSDPLDQ
jgi:hypothetical protein